MGGDTDNEAIAIMSKMSQALFKAKYVREILQKPKTTITFGRNHPEESIFSLVEALKTLKLLIFATFVFFRKSASFLGDCTAMITTIH